MSQAKPWANSQAKKVKSVKKVRENLERAGFELVGLTQKEIYRRESDGKTIELAFIGPDTYCDWEAGWWRWPIDTSSIRKGILEYVCAAPKSAGYDS